jgi:hypothetical protein
MQQRKLVASPPRGELGQTIVMFSFSMVALLGFVAIVFDFGSIYQERRQLQNAADGAALAAAGELPAFPSVAVTAAQTVLAANGYNPADTDVTVVVNTSDLGDPEEVEIRVTKHNKSFLFARVFGLVSTDVSARAAAEIVSAHEDEYAIFAIDDSCGAPGVDISGGLATFNGTVHTNSNVAVGGSNHTFDPSVTYHCDFSEGGSGHTYSRGQKKTGARDVPTAVSGITYSTFAPCDFSFPNPTNLKSRNDIWQNPAKTLLMDGVYCFAKSVTLIGDDITGNVTFAAQGSINISGSDHDLTAYHPSGILLFTSADGAGDEIDVTGSGGQWTGIMYAPDGEAKVGGQGNLNYSGSIIAQSVSVSGNGMSITSSSLVDNGNPVVRLTE